MNRVSLFFHLACLLAGLSPLAGTASELSLNGGDRVVFVGNTFVERAQSSGYLETFLTCRHPKQKIVFRNLGWSGDTVFGSARAGFGTTADGFKHLAEEVSGLKPSVVLVGYGMNESFEGQAGLPEFRKGLETLLAFLGRGGARIVLLSPIRHEDLGRPLPDPTQHNRDLRLYCDLLRETAAERGYPYVDLFETLHGDGKPLTDDGIHLTASGYWWAALAIGRGLGLDPPQWQVELNSAGTAVALQGTKISGIRTVPRGLRFELTDAVLPFPLPPESTRPDAVPAEAARVLRVRSLPAGRSVLKIDGMPVASAAAPEWAAGVRLVRGPELDQVEALRKAIVAKNRLSFQRWRPQNETYLFGFRKYEQGQNAKEVPQLDPLVAEQEASIEKLCVPVSHVYELFREGEVGK